MSTPAEAQHAGLESVQAITALLQRSRQTHPTHALYEAAELQFWWSTQRSTDTFPQLFWVDEQGPVAAVVVNDFGGNVRSLVYDEPTALFAYLPDCTPDWIAQVVDRGLAHLNAGGIDAIELEVDQADDVMASIVRDRGFELKGDAVIEASLDAALVPAVSDLADGYRLLARSQTPDRRHHLSRPDGPDRQERLSQVSLYRSDLDLFVVDADDNWAANAMFWLDPVTETGVVEPVRTADEHQGRGLSRHLLTVGVNMLAREGAKRIGIGWEPDNPASGHLYQSVGFQAHRRTDLWGGPTGP